MRTTQFPALELALEIGSGCGEFLVELSKRFQHVMAVDNSAEMLQVAQQTIASSAANNVTFVHGEIASLPAEHNQFDCIIANMVLHHVANPVAIFNHSAQLLKCSGSLLISELSHHSRPFPQQGSSDLWLGFSALELSTSAQQSGLVDGESQYFGLRNGFQVQVRRFYHPHRSAS